MFKWVMRLLAGAVGNKPNNVTFNQREKVDPTIELIETGRLVGELRIEDGMLFMWKGTEWEGVCRIPDQGAVKSPSDLPIMAPFGHHYRIGADDWTWDGGSWVNNSAMLRRQREEADQRRIVELAYRAEQAKKASQPRRQVIVTDQHHTGSRPIGDPHPTDSGVLMTAVVVNSLLNDDAPARSHTTSHSRHDDTPSYTPSSHDTTHHTPHDSGPSHDYGSSDFGGGSFD
ncbi:hypothetical protein pEaSNUABM37_00200 [Erwinia phage pEa_SNUABM_37]|nr:hypothetical protein pEaSNUABM37_00200 [Erwinia phage pEa_SNUABM_37]QXO10670.1 hypothetical protein pEaSNUABM48_00200 [Erwinia phage pEa_SNUABM_48]